jgi:hypothetical protein
VRVSAIPSENYDLNASKAFLKISKVLLNSAVEVGVAWGRSPPSSNSGGGGVRKSRIYYVTEEIQPSGDTKYRMYSRPRTTRENVTLVHLQSRISVTISTKIFSFDLKNSSRIFRLLNYN